jgi:hypothetical protein
MSGDHNMNQKRMRTHKDKLQALLSYLSINVVITSHRLMAEKAYDWDDETWSWHCLLLWVEAKDGRAKLWKWFQKEYHDAVMLKEGYYETYK